ncbi:hypothetical protein D3C79_225340 [compost metagenome]
MALWVLLISIVIFLLINSDSIFRYIFSYKRKSLSDSGDDFFYEDNQSKEIYRLKSNFDKNYFLGTNNIPECSIDFILSRLDIPKAITLYNISKDCLEYDVNKGNFLIKNHSNIVFERNDGVKNCNLTVGEKSIVNYIFYVCCAMASILIFSFKFNGQIDENLKEFILSVAFTILFIFIGATQYIKYMRLKFAKEFMELV